MLIMIVLLGTVAGVVHFVILGALYGNPVVDGIYSRAQVEEPGVRKWDSKPRYLVTQFLGTQVEIYILTGAYLWLRGFIPLEGWGPALALGAIFAAIRVYPRFWNMWIQSTYPTRLLGIELINGTIGTFVVVLCLEICIRIGFTPS